MGNGIHTSGNDFTSLDIEDRPQDVDDIVDTCDIGNGFDGDADGRPDDGAVHERPADDTRRTHEGDDGQKSTDNQLLPRQSDMENRRGEDGVDPDADTGPHAGQDGRNGNEEVDDVGIQSRMLLQVGDPGSHIGHGTAGNRSHDISQDDGLEISERLIDLEQEEERQGAESHIESKANEEHGRHLDVGRDDTGQVPGNDRI